MSVGAFYLADGCQVHAKAPAADPAHVGSGSGLHECTVELQLAEFSITLLVINEGQSH